MNEEVIRSTAQTLIDSGLAKAGYTYVNIDDCWAVTRDAAGRVIADNKTFPSGMYKLGQYIHSLGLQFGIYSDAGTNTCAGRPGSLGHEVIDALTYAAWGVDYLKYDNCNANTDPRTRYPPMRDALNATGRPILFSMCEWGVDNPATWSADVGNSWRTTGDINDSWRSMISNLDQNDQVWNYSGPGHWNDPDMLEVGNGGMTDAEYQAHFALWALIKSPLLIGCDITKMSTSTASILMNAEVIALSQDDLGVQGHRLSGDPAGGQVWAGPLANGDVGVILFNRGAAAANITVPWTLLGLKEGSTGSVRDLVAHRVEGEFAESYSALVPSHAVKVIRVTLVKPRRVANIRHAYMLHPRMEEVLQGRRSARRVATQKSA